MKFSMTGQENGDHLILLNRGDSMGSFDSIGYYKM
jgi:hypothetical protein